MFCEIKYCLANKMSAKKKCLTLEKCMQRIKVLESEKSSRTVANEVSVGHTQIQNVLKLKHEILDEYEQWGYKAITLCKRL